MNLSLNNIILYSFDFFIFKPKLLKENIFNKWINNTKSPEEYFHDILINNNIIHCIIPRYDNNFYLPRRIDLIGLWHDHDLYRLYFKLLSDEINKILPIEYSIEEFNLKLLEDEKTINELNIGDADEEKLLKRFATIYKSSSSSSNKLYYFHIDVTDINNNDFNELTNGKCFKISNDF